jgi:hypothetical protein
MNFSSTVISAPFNCERGFFVVRIPNCRPQPKKSVRASLVLGHLQVGAAHARLIQLIGEKHETFTRCYAPSSRSGRSRRIADSKSTQDGCGWEPTAAPRPVVYSGREPTATSRSLAGSVRYEELGLNPND